MKAQHGFVNSSPESCKQALRMNLARIYHIFACMCFRSVSQHLFDQGTNDHHAWLLTCEPSAERHMNTHLTQLAGGLIQAGCNHMLCQSEIHTQHAAQRSNNICDGISVVLCMCAFYWRLHDVSFWSIHTSPCKPLQRCMYVVYTRPLLFSCKPNGARRACSPRLASLGEMARTAFGVIVSSAAPSLLLTAFRCLFLQIVC